MNRTALDVSNTFVACSRPSEDRTIPLSIIAERTKLTVEDVEYLLMKSLSVSASSLVNGILNVTNIKLVMNRGGKFDPFTLEWSFWVLFYLTGQF